ncbi:hypothetical protein ATI61_12642 [Archangium gephyra]|uniref:Uncharacterized protein n=1 Tax=Archangium gephyra TaxID=48 RepID=A0AAC8QIG1_9BACT|nr:hypothetical protein [Archangium gephyra]AKJ08253.1 Hypothetical protein AA314_09879 [Archangium gephyra]REG15366.1 hypothetical protein ATI61_12642 [Archangium gephyra]
MNNQSRFLLPLGAALLLGAALVLHFLLSGPVAGAPAGTPPATTVSPGSPSASTPAVMRAQPAAPVKSGPDAVVTSEGRGATVVPPGPGDEVPEPEVENAPPQQNEPIEPEKPQTAEWKHGKLVRITELLTRDVERLEAERAVAEAKGDKEEAKRLGIQLSRHRARLEKLHEQTAALAGQASQERATR